MTSALIIFVKNARLGTVKTRLAHTLGEDNALQIYQKLLQHTCRITTPLVVDKYVFYSEQMEADDLWVTGKFKKELQLGPDLGKRMEAAFKMLFEKGYGKVVIIGSDCYDLSAKIIVQAFTILTEKEVVIGPALDGGYYLLGMTVFVPLFDGINWSTDGVFAQTVARVNALNYSLALLPVLRDVDTAEDITFDY